MLRSMTGYGRAESLGDDYSVAAEIRSVNGKFFKAHSKLPPQLSRFELDIEKLLKQSFSRGTIDLTMRFQRPSNPAGYTFNGDAARAYWRQLDKLKKEFGIEAPVTFELLATLPGVLESEAESPADAETLWPHVQAAVVGAANQLTNMREKEGIELKNDLAEHMGSITSVLDQIKERVPLALEEYKTRLRDRVRQLLNGTDVTVSDQDLAREIVLYIERSNISEELARLASHIKQFETTMSSPGPVGRQLEFIGQEMHREANTMGSKVNDAALSNFVTEIKTAIDKIREQVLNIE